MKNVPRSTRFAIATIALFLIPLTNVCGQFANTDPLKPYTACKVPGSLEIKEVTRRNAGSKNREVTTDEGKQKVSVVDGYRVMFAYRDLTYYFANVKIEQSASDLYPRDKGILINQLKHFSTSKDVTKLVFTDKTSLNGFEHYGLERDKIDVGGVLGTHLLFYDPAHLVVTVYILNQSKAVLANNRRFENLEQYRSALLARPIHPGSDLSSVCTSLTDSVHNCIVHI